MSIVFMRYTVYTYLCVPYVHTYVLQQQGSGGATSHEMMIRSFDVPTKCDHCTSFMQGQVRQGMTCKGGLSGMSLLGRSGNG